MHRVVKEKFSNICILREIKFGGSKASIADILTIFEGLIVRISNLRNIKTISPRVFISNKIWEIDQFYREEKPF